MEDNLFKNNENNVIVFSKCLKLLYLFSKFQKNINLYSIIMFC